jgi:hypothetical protein
MGTKKIIYTGNFANVKKYTAKGLYPISIALSARYFSGKCYRKLNPDRSFLDDEPKTYEKKYNKILEALNPVDVVNELFQISEGKDIVLLCHESQGVFCHRRLVAKWLEKNLNIEVKELGKMEQQMPIFAN